MKALALLASVVLALAANSLADHHGHVVVVGGSYCGPRYGSYGHSYGYGYCRPYSGYRPYYGAYGYGGYGYGGYAYAPAVSFSYTSAPRTYYRPTSETGDSSLEVDVQRALKHRGYYSGSVDGDIGPGSRSAIRSFQNDHGLQPTGRIDSTLLRALGV